MLALSSPYTLDLASVPTLIRTARAVSDGQGGRLVIETTGDRNALEDVLRGASFRPAADGGFRRTNVWGTLNVYTGANGATFVVSLPRNGATPSRASRLYRFLAGRVVKGLRATGDGLLQVRVGYPSAPARDRAYEALSGGGGSYATVTVRETVGGKPKVVGSGQLNFTTLRHGPLALTVFRGQGLLDGGSGDSGSELRIALVGTSR